MIPRLALSLLLILGACRAAPDLPSVLNDDGGWCWFQDERALALDDVVVFGSIAAGRGDPSRRGDVELTYWWPATGVTRRVELHDQLQLDDHDAPALLELADGRLLAVYARHGTDRLVRWRRTVEPGDPLTWGPERTLAIEDAGPGVTYANLHHGSQDGEVFNLFRGPGWDPNVIVSHDSGDSWELRGRLLGGPGRPYLKYASDGPGNLHWIASDQHPRDFDNSIYHGFLRDGRVHDSDGTVVGEVGEDPPAPGDLTRVFQGSPAAVAWPVDLELDRDGRPVAVFSVQTDGAGQPRGKGGLDHRFYYARFDGARWRVSPLAHAGRRLYAGEDDYTGLAAIDPGDCSVVYLSTDAHPATGQPLISRADGRRHRELFRARTEDFGASWTFEPISADSTADNLRPIVPAGSPHVLLWLRGELSTYTDYALEVMGLAL
jgi:BNR repeat-containing family member